MVDAEPASSVELDAEIVRLGRRIVDQSRRDGRHVSWRVPHVSGIASSGAAEWRMGETTPWLYDGLSGIARGLAYAAIAVRSIDASLATAMSDIARQACDDALDRSGTLGSELPSGLYDGVSGVACASVEVARVTGDDGLGRRALALARMSLARASGTDSDLISGVAGQVCAAGWLTAWTGESWARDACPRLADELLTHTLPEGGLAHGTSGLAVAFAHAARVSRSSRFAVAARRGAARGSHRGSGSGGPRPASGSPAWCHGLSGRGLAQLRVASLIGGSPTYARPVTAAVQRVAVTGQQADGLPGWVDWSLCHGACGAAALLLEAGARMADDVAFLRCATTLLRTGMHEAVLRDGRWQGGCSTDEEQPGLMTGHAGILLVLLRARYTGRASPPWPLWL